MIEQEVILKIKKIRRLANECLASLSASKLNGQPSVFADEPKSEGKVDYIVAIVNEIRDCEDSEHIEQQILKKPSVSNKVLMVFYIAHKYFSGIRLTSGDTAKVLRELGFGNIKTANASVAIANSLSKYLLASSTRLRGRKNTYKLNNRGKQYFEQLLNEDR